MAERIHLFTTSNSLHATPNPSLHATLNRPLYSIKNGQRPGQDQYNIHYLRIQLHLRQLNANPSKMIATIPVLYFSSSLKRLF